MTEEVDLTEVGAAVIGVEAAVLGAVIDRMVALMMMVVLIGEEDPQEAVQEAVSR